jgi:uncharacterized membrane protein YgcG
MRVWSVGKAGCSNGIVLAVATADQQMWIAADPGAQEYLSRNELAAVLDRMKPLLQYELYTDAIELCISDIANRLKLKTIGASSKSVWKDTREIAHHYGKPQKTIISIAWLFVLVAIAANLFCTARSNRWKKQLQYTGSKRGLSQIESERAEAKAKRFQVQSCAICMESFAETASKTRRLFPCGHTFHHDCVEAWEESKRVCPVCRRPTQVESLETAHKRQKVVECFAPHNRDHRAHNAFSDGMANQWIIPDYF